MKRFHVWLFAISSLGTEVRSASIKALLAPAIYFGKDCLIFMPVIFPPSYLPFFWLQPCSLRFHVLCHSFVDCWSPRHGKQTLDRTAGNHALGTKHKIMWEKSSRKLLQLDKNESGFNVVQSRIYISQSGTELLSTVGTVSFKDGTDKLSFFFASSSWQLSLSQILGCWYGAHS